MAPLGELFNMYREIPSITDKAAWALAYTRNLDDPAFRTGSPEAHQAFLRDLIAFYVVFEGMWFYTGFAQILSHGRRNKMVGVAEQYQYVLRDESIHLNFRHRCHQSEPGPLDPCVSGRGARDAAALESARKRRPETQGFTVAHSPLDRHRKLRLQWPRRPHHVRQGLRVTEETPPRLP
jgi:ribonucleoside-diphosphate reductase beta chain